MRDLENRFGDEIVVVGVHSAKYTAEGDDTHLRAAVRRLNLTHPIVNDRDMQIWSEYGVRAWPSLMFISPQGRVIGKHEGEFPLEPMRTTIDQMLEEFRQNGTLTSDPLQFDSAAEETDTVLAFPTAVEFEAQSERLIIADTNHNRIVFAGLDGSISTIIGSGSGGMADGPGDAASFRRPHGLALQGNQLYVADTDNHAIRRVDLDSGNVSTIAGTGSATETYLSGGPPLATPLRSPWDLTINEGIIYIAMAGNHQLWMHRPGSQDIRRFAGTGHEGKRDGTIQSAWLAQPSGIGPLDSQLVFTDAETSSVRICDLLGSGGEVTTLVGKDLFDWGDTDGPVQQALLQHPAGVTADPEHTSIYIADTYNNKIKLINLNTGIIESFAGSGRPALVDGRAAGASFFEPHGLAQSDTHLYVADTNNHAIRSIQKTNGCVKTILISSA